MPRPPATRPAPGSARPASRRPLRDARSPAARSARVRRDRAAPVTEARVRRVVRRALLLAVAFVGLVAWLRFGAGSSAAPVPAWRARIVTVALSQVGTRTDPADSYCNPYSAYWDAGGADCGAGERSEEWCADFAAWVWRRVGVPFSYGYGPGDINAGAVSFERWGVAHGTWHPAGDGYRARPGDVAVYGLDTATGSADHVAVVVRLARGAAGPEVVNGDGDRTGFSVVELGHDEHDADTPGSPSPLSGYVSPLPPPASHAGS